MKAPNRLRLALLAGVVFAPLATLAAGSAHPPPPASGPARLLINPDGPSPNLPNGLEEDIRSVSVFLRATGGMTDISSGFSLEAGHIAFERLKAQDLSDLHLLLNNAGYYDPLIRYEAEEAATGTPASASASASVRTVVVETGPPYVLSAYGVDGVPTGVLLAPPAFGQRATAPLLVQAEDHTLARLGDSGYPLARYTGRLYRVDHTARTVEADLTVDPGPVLTFGTLTYGGLDRTRVSYLRRLVPWKEGARYDGSAVEAYRRALLETELFNTVRVRPATFSEDGTTLPLSVEVTERRPRTLGGRVSYDTDFGPGVEVFWQHRNVARGGERLDLSGGYALNWQHLEAALRIPQWPDRRMTFLTSFKLTNERSDAYNETGVIADVGVERRLSSLWSASAGARIRYSDVNSDRVATLSLPLMLRGDRTTSKLNPARGWRAATTLTPSFAVEGEQGAYMTWDQRGSAYFPLNRERTLITALWGHVGGVIGASVTDIAPTSRFYAGGGGSVRGYGYRSLGPRDAAGDPLGGTSLVEGGVEVRFPVRGAVSGVVFAEGGSVSETLVPNASHPQFGAGIGVRYTTSFAPLRLDVGVPLNRRRGDAPYQLYLSIGRAF